ncbi:hypothetical protein NMG60_11029743 [Bertholletia excelsa]
METPVDDKFVVTESLVGVDSDLLTEPYEGMVFESDEAAKAFYDEYARQIGFLTRIVSSRKSERDGSIISRRLACNKEGHNLNNKKAERVRLRKRESKREGCMAMILVKRQKPGRWVVTKFVKEHNHALAISSGKDHLTPDDKDKKIRDLSAQLQHANQQLAACQEELQTIMTCIEEHALSLSRTVEDIVSNVKKVEPGRQ